MNYKEIKEGDWLFTCSMKPLQFGKWNRGKNREDYSKGAFSDEAWEEFSMWDDFQTKEGSYHSRKNCSLSPITNGYAKWFNDNKIWELYDRIVDAARENKLSTGDEWRKNVWEDYEKAVKEVCIRDGILYEGY